MVFLNMTESDLRALLDKHLYAIGELLMEYYDCCHIEGDQCRAGKNMCCVNSVFGEGLCPHWRDNACQNPNADCKLWICQTAIKNTDERCIKSLILLEQFAGLYGLLRAPIIGLPYSGADRQPE